MGHVKKIENLLIEGSPKLSRVSPNFRGSISRGKRQLTLSLVEAVSKVLRKRERWYTSNKNVYLNSMRIPVDYGLEFLELTL